MTTIELAPLEMECQCQHGDDVISAQVCHHTTDGGCNKHLCSKHDVVWAQLNSRTSVWFCKSHRDSHIDDMDDKMKLQAAVEERGALGTTIKTLGDKWGVNMDTLKSKIKRLRGS